MNPPARQSGFTLLELLIVVALLSLVAGIIIPNANPSLHDQLEGAAEVVAGDVALARSLAVANDTSYKITFDRTRNQYTLTHSGTNPAFDELPKSPYAQPGDPPTEFIVRMSRLPHLRGSVRIHAVRALSTTPQNVTDLEFGPLGETTRPEETQIWLAGGVGPARRYLSVRVSPVTGLTWIEDFRASDPVASGSSMIP